MLKCIFSQTTRTILFIIMLTSDYANYLPYFVMGRVCITVNLLIECVCVCVCVWGGGGGGVCTCTKINIRSLISSTFPCEKRHSREDEELTNDRIILSCKRAFLMVSLLMRGGGGGCSNAHCFLANWKK